MPPEETACLVNEGCALYLIVKTSVWRNITLIFTRVSYHFNPYHVDHACYILDCPNTN